MQIRTQFSQFFSSQAAPFLRQVVINKYKQREEKFSQIFDVMTSDRAIEQFNAVSGVGLLAGIGEGSPISTDHIVQEFLSTFTHSKFGLAVPTTQEMIDDDKWRLVRASHEALGRSTKETIELDAASTINTGTSVNGYDGVPLFSTSHPRPKAGGTQSNLAAAAADLSYTSLQLALTDYELQTDTSGILVRVPAAKLVVAPAFRWMAYELTKSTDRPDSANRATNTLGYAESGMLEPFVWQYLTDADSWGIFANPSDTGLCWIWRKKPYTKSWYDDAREVGFMAMRYRKSHGWYDYKGTYWTAGA